ncbi:alpha/beta hydrolase family protein [Phenylobacterium sp.]|uniref:alpha/beta hydrolase family protein n=1 Tax=Phenylobacterium sp. TaxID=1871053 RepID=UPI002D00DBAB|nr:dienelactone hydrolase family protein [Phenylobacterium sp.]HLZ74311.1 dienelactone hydrolase family protein [Phenylobacterium sp.]
MKALAAMAAILALAGQARAANVGFETASAPVASDKPLALTIWYPTDAPERAVPLSLYVQSVATGAAPAGHGHPLVVISHGTGGANADHYDTARALAAAGFVVAALTHTGDTQGDRSRSMRITERPAELSRVIDYVTRDWRGHDAVDPAKIGAFGFSSGGFTVLAAIGGEPDLTTLARHCAEHPHFYDCALQRQLGGAAATPANPAAVAHDPRIKAAVVAAPALGFAFAPNGLSRVAIPVQLWRAEWDTVLPQPYYAQAVHGLLPKAEYHVVPAAEHFDFMAPCSANLAKVAPSICVDNIDRTAFHKTFNSDVVRFFRTTLGS